MSELACVGFSYFFSQFFFFKNRDSFLCFKNNQIDDCAVLNFFYFFMVTILLSNSTHTEQKRCDHESGFVRKRIDRRVGDTQSLNFSNPNYFKEIKCIYSCT